MNLWIVVVGRKEESEWMKYNGKGQSRMKREKRDRNMTCYLSAFHRQIFFSGFLELCYCLE